MAVLNKPRIEAYVGASGSGKGVSIEARLRELKPARLLIWDPRNEYQAHAHQVRSAAEFVRRLRAAGDGPIKLRLMPEVPGSMDHKRAASYLHEVFGIFCGAAFASGNLVLLAEELSDVTTASYAPPAWRQCITQGRHQGLHVIGATQRPALIDKTFLGNATRIRCFTLRYQNDRQAMAQVLDVPLDDITKLQTVETDTGVMQRVSIGYLERDFREQWTKRDTIVMTRKARAT
jgi:hypothetical protein